ncbi:ABC transporter permease [Maribacter polysiphoniae]|uniref:ABC transporter permease n=1 Tax=Maribacter polysiphoniae TaxID=429344 RepID=A0A316E638_9FLAO|nr:FtsX-like permease family protein [Maribacter polysiphoniae]MBD1260077.1 ABC transporter permease [Maribacter polysiphoniae]PWK25536.1 lipoprotein-releasing system permease protein [Maribacter polysiphoniae]
MNFPFYIAQRYLRSKSSQNAVNIINFVTFIVIVIGSASLFIVLSGFAGLKTFSLSYTNIFDPDLKATPTTGKFFSVNPEQEQALAQITDIASFSKELEEQVSFTHKGKNHFAYIKGVDQGYTTTTEIDSALIFGNWFYAPQQGVAGIGLTNKLGLTINQTRNPLVVIAPKPGKGSLSQTKPYNELPLVISGVYSVEEDLDHKYVFTDLALVQALLEKDTTMVSGINFKLLPDADTPELRNKIAAIFKNTITLKNREELNSSLYRMLNTENLATYLIFTLVLIIALFNVVGAIIMMILDKQQNSKTLFSLGSTIKDLRRIYFVQGVIVTTAGGVIGVLLASILIWSQLAFGWLKITPSLSYPVEYRLVNILIVLATIIVLGIIASKIASSRITKKLISI